MKPNGIDLLGKIFVILSEEKYNANDKDQQID